MSIQKTAWDFRMGIYIDSLVLEVFTSGSGGGGGST